MSYKDFRNRHPNGGIIDVDHYPLKNPYQCVDLVKEYLIEEFQVGNGSYGDAAQWATPNGALKAALDKAGLEHWDTKSVEPGDIVPLAGVNGNKDGHIGIATGNQDGNQFELLEQNGSTGNGKGEGNDRIRTRWIPKSRILCLYRHKSVSAAAQAAQVDIVINPGKWNVRTAASMDDSAILRPDYAKGVVANENKVLGGQKYGAFIDANGWAAIDFRGVRRFIGPKAFKKA
jgi:hypothetical protein